MPLLTLTSDIGNTDYLVGAIKAQLMQMNETFQLVDVSHAIPPFNLPQAAYVCRSAIQYFPDYSYHLILVNLFEQPPKQLLLAFHNNQYLLCADNGLLTMILEETPELVIGLPLDKDQGYNTIQLVAVMGNVVNQLAEGQSIQRIGNPDVTYMQKTHLRPVIGNNQIACQIIYIDSFENIIVNITKEQFEEQRQGRKFQIVLRRSEVIDKISETYSSVPEGEKLALFNSAGYLEIAINKGNAAGLFGLYSYSEKLTQGQLSYHTVRIFFI
ncbi:MAG: SAM-dependent chlorinase/fluorinase [Chitinophagaceae bacterium]